MRTYWCNKIFTDSKKFPYGFSRSGVFSLAESRELECKGSLFQALLNGEVFDPTAEDMAFVRAINAGVYSFNEDTRVWSKYMFHQRRMISISGGWISSDIDESLADDLTILEDESGTEPKWEVEDSGGSDDFLKAS